MSEGYGALYDIFGEEIERQFGFLAEHHGFGRWRFRDNAQHGITAWAKNDTTAVEIEYDPMDESLEVYVIKLRNGRKPPMDEAWGTRWALLWELAKQEGKADAIIGTLSKRSEVAMTAALARYAKALADFRDVLDGDFDRFDALDRTEMTEEQRFGVTGYDPKYPQTMHDPGPYRDSVKRWLRRTFGGNKTHG